MYIKYMYVQHVCIPDNGRHRSEFHTANVLQDVGQVGISSGGDWNGSLLLSHGISLGWSSLLNNRQMDSTKT